MGGNVKIFATTTLAGLALVLTTLNPVSASWDPNKEQKELNKANDAMVAFKKKDPSLKTFFDKAHAYVYFPRLPRAA